MMEKNPYEPYETFDRGQYRRGCKYCTPYETCIKDSGFIGWGMHLTVACTPESKCPRMKRYDKMINGE